MLANLREYLRVLHVLPHWVRRYTSHFPSHQVTVY